MGLLSDPEYGSVKWVRVLKKVHKPLCVLCYVGAIVWFAMLGNREFNNETYFSENALLPGLVTNEFNGEFAAKQFYNDLLQELEHKYEDTDEMPVPWLVGKMSQLQLEVYTHNFTLNYPLSHGMVYKGINVYGILRAPRTPSLEAIVVSAPYRALGSHQKGTAAGIALMLAFAQFARPQKYWAKDIIFLVTQHEQLGMQAWLEAYHGLQSGSETFYSSLGSFWDDGQMSLDFGKLLEKLGMRNSHEKCLDPGKLKGRSGSIQAAINLEIHDPKIKYIEVKVEGLNGQLPNLDLVNLVHKLSVKSGIHHSYKNSYSWIRTRDKMEEWKNNLLTMLEMVSTQIAGVPNGNHGLFHRFGIEAVTLEGRDANDPSPAPRAKTLAPAAFRRLGATLESVLRSLNNLLERFHQSYFFYLLAATNRFVSIGQYMPCLCLPCVAMLVRALSLWVTLQQEPDDVKEAKEGTSEKKNEENEKLEQDKEQESPDDDKSEEVTSEESTLRHRKKTKSQEKLPGKHTSVETSLKQDSHTSIVNIGANYILIHVLGYGVMNTPVFLSYFGAAYFDKPSEVSIFYGLIYISVFQALIAPLIILIFQRITREEMTLVNILVLIELATVCLAVGMHNFSLGLAVAIAYTPLALIAGICVDHGTYKSKCGRVARRLICLLLHPLSILLICMSTYACTLFPEEGLKGCVGRGAEALMQAITFAVVDSMIYGNWLFNVATTAFLPIWLIFWQLTCHTVKP